MDRRVWHGALGAAAVAAYALAECDGDSCERPFRIRSIPPWHTVEGGGGAYVATKAPPAWSASNMQENNANLNPVSSTPSSNVLLRLLYASLGACVALVRCFLTYVYTVTVDGPLSLVGFLLHMVSVMCTIVLAPVISICEAIYTVTIAWPLQMMEDHGSKIYQLYVFVGVGVCFGMVVGICSVVWMCLEHRLYIARGARRTVVQRRPT